MWILEKNYLEKKKSDLLSLVKVKCLYIINCVLRKHCVSFGFLKSIFNPNCIAYLKVDLKVKKECLPQGFA